MQVMRILEQGIKLPVQQCMLEAGEERITHGYLFPNTIRGLLVGPSGCGKTNLMITLLQHKNGLRYENVYIVSKSLFQEKYQKLQKIYRMLPEIGYHTFDTPEKICEPQDCKPNSIVIFDDVSSSNEANPKLRAYFSMGRHKNISVFLLIQSYSRISKHLIRDNANFIVLFKQDALNTRHVYDDHLSADLSFKRFQSICALCWKERYGFLVIDTQSPINRGRLRCSLYHFISLSNEGET